MLQATHRGWRMKSGSYDRHVRESRSRPRSCLRPTPTIGKRSLPLVQRQRREVMVHPERFERPTLRFVVLWRSEEHTSELQSLMRISYAVFCLKKKKNVTLIH